jgi:hypothetical protein
MRNDLEKCTRLDGRTYEMVDSGVVVIGHDWGGVMVVLWGEQLGIKARILEGPPHWGDRPVPND